MKHDYPELTLAARFERQFQASRIRPVVPLALRRDRLRRLQAVLEVNGERLADAARADFGARSHEVTRLSELVPLQWELHHALRHLRNWMRSRRVRTPLQLQPARAHLMPQPLGVVGVIAPWNYPISLALGPSIAALAAGNRVLLKPSELTPHTAACLAQCLAMHFELEEFDVIQGDITVASAFSALRFDHLVFTGSPAVARKIAAAAAANLVPTTLELGGKSPCLIDSAADFASVMPAIVNGKLLNCGQTCIAPDYVLLPRGREADFVQAFNATVQRFYPQIVGNPDYTALLDERGLARMLSLLYDAQDQGARVIQVGVRATEKSDSVQRRQLPPTLVLDTRPQMRVMQEEIFGPILPIVPYDTLDEAIAYINAGPRPLALYWFGNDSARTKKVLSETVSGAAVMNETLLHFAHANLPFGGVGESGWGAYHGEAGFLRLSHLKPVFRQLRWNASSLLHPPYGPGMRRILDMLARW
ncbi:MULTISPECIES: aldehyde dehydrogenase family protein [unclassified Variovorax]|uniref:aldehyde dehydrogenase family protein n=1 Tax=unclassified Variovorax TaxID=663243 RepID=UPI0032E773C0